jgi:hypothetical protein
MLVLEYLQHMARSMSCDAQRTKQLASEGWRQQVSQIWPTATRRAPGDTVSWVLAGGESRWLVGESHDQRRVEWAV